MAKTVKIEGNDTPVYFGIKAMERINNLDIVKSIVDTSMVPPFEYLKSIVTVGLEEGARKFVTGKKWSESEVEDVFDDFDVVNEIYEYFNEVQGKYNEMFKRKEDDEGKKK